VTTTPPPSPQPISIAYTSTLQPWAKVLYQCALEHPEIALITKETSSMNLEFSSADLTLWFGEPPQGIHDFAVSLGEDEIIIIAGSEVVLRNLNVGQLREIYTEPTSIYHVWTYSEENTLRAAFDSIILGEISPSSDLLSAPDPEAMRDAVATDPVAIGYIPESWLTEDYQKITLERELQLMLKSPILAATAEVPEGNVKNYLVCLQQNNNP
jgi:DNA-binding transcriptional LysR family regulator